MAWTKRQLIEQAFGELAVKGQAYDIEPEEYELALGRMDAMVATWESSRGVRIGYAFGGDIEADAGIPDGAAEAVFLNLAVRIAPSFGKQLQPETKAQAGAAYNGLLIEAAKPREQQFSNTVPRGQGTKPWRTYNRPYLPKPSDSPLAVAQGGDLDIAGE